MLYAAPALAEKWPGLLGPVMTPAHRQLMMIVYGLAGAIGGHFAFNLNDYWPARVIWLLIWWGLWLFGLFVLGGLVTVGK